MIKWIRFCRCVLATMIILPVAFVRAADKPIVLSPFTLLSFMTSKVAQGGWARDWCRDCLQRCAVKAWRCLAADARHDTFMFHACMQNIDVQHQTSLGQTM
jgi:hypothetical protein